LPAPIPTTASVRRRRISCSADHCRFAFVESRQERAFIQRADAIGLRYPTGPHIDGYNINSGRAISIATFRSESF
jgi:hypothetical protein